MNVKGIVTIALLVFIGVSVFVLVSDKRAGSDEAISESSPEEPLKPDFEANAIPGKVAVYYFHYNRRCATCNRLEELARKVIGNRFVDELNDGSLIFKSVNVEDEGNGHFETDYGFTVQSLIIVDGRADRIGEWKNLDKIWELVWKEPEYLDYVDAEIRAFLERH